MSDQTSHVQTLLDDEATPERLKEALRPVAALNLQLRERAMAARAKLKAQIKTHPPDTDPE